MVYIWKIGLLAKKRRRASPWVIKCHQIKIFVIAVAITTIIFAIAIFVVTIMMTIMMIRPGEQAVGGCCSLLWEDPSPSAGSTGRRSDHYLDHEHDNHHHQHHDHNNHHHHCQLHPVQAVQGEDLIIINTIIIIIINNLMIIIIISSCTYMMIVTKPYGILRGRAPLASRFGQCLLAGTSSASCCHGGDGDGVKV